MTEFLLAILASVIGVYVARWIDHLSDSIKEIR